MIGGTAVVLVNQRHTNVADTILCGAIDMILDHFHSSQREVTCGICNSKHELVSLDVLDGPTVKALRQKLLTCQRGFHFMLAIATFP